MRHILLLPALLAANASAHPLPIAHGHEASMLSFPWLAALGILALCALAVLLSRKPSR